MSLVVVVGRGALRRVTIVLGRIQRLEVEGEDEEKKAGGCPLRRVQLWHTIPLCLLAIINLLLVIIALLGLAGYRITMGIQNFLVNLAKTDLECNPYAESLADTDDGTLVTEKE